MARRKGFQQRSERLTLDDIREMVECYEYYRTGPCPMTFLDVAFVFDCSVQTVKRVFNDSHPLMLKHGLTCELILKEMM